MLIESKIPQACIIVFILIFPGINTFGQVFKRRINAYNENGQRTGVWLSFWDDDEKIPMSKAFYKNGYENRVSKEYHQNGKMRLKFRYYKDNRLKVKFYTENRVLEAKGGAVIEYNKEDTHFYYHGKWKYFSPKRKLIRVGWYEHGNEIIGSEDN